MNDRSLRLYALISGFKSVKTYKSKIMLIAFIGTHIPLLSMLVYVVFSHSLTLATTINLLAIALIATLLGTIATLFALHYLLAPVKLTSQALQHYLEQQKLPNLPTHFNDEVGTLMADTNRTIKQLDRLIRYTTNYNNLTGLPNQDLFQNLLQQTLAQANNNQQIGVIIVHLSSIKDINSILGRKISNLLQKKIALRLANRIKKIDILAHLSEDEFGIIKKNFKSFDELNFFTQEVIELLNKPFSLFGKEINTNPKLGITVYPFDGITAEQLLQNANTALYQIRQEEHQNCQFYSIKNNTKLQRRLAIKDQLRYALRRGELFLHYQPRLDLTNNYPVGVEALLRWQNPQLGLVPPTEFIPIAEQSKLIVSIGEWVLRSACIQQQIWQQEGLPALRISVNLSVNQFKQSNLIKRIDEILAETNFNPNYLELEVTESLFVENFEQTIRLLKQLKHRGINLSLDDFGTGYSSLSYLQQFPIDTLKIDRSFLFDIPSNTDNTSVTKGIIALAQSLNLHITAEGVENSAQLEYLKAQGCHEVQGYYFSKPLSAYNLTSFLSSYYRQLEETAS
ncbi:diguanylate cyclase/phosphodiesterase [Stanieria sp. NIES-3757]|nr:diguanylate cyclase/phosphodiesterase [Stanieria sp. NIES-3757]